MALSQAAKQAYARDGYLVLPGLLDAGLVSELRARVSALASGEAALPERVERMAEPAVARGAPATEPAARTRKLEGVALGADPVLRRATFHPGLVAVMQDLLGPDLKLLRAAAMLKPPRLGSAKGLHQDAAYYPIEPREHVAAWIALEPATRENGCLEVLPGAHAGGFQEHERREYETDVVIRGTTGDEGGLVALPMAPGDVLLTHCLTPHRSGPNRTGTWRRALILAYMGAQSRYTVPAAERPPWVASLSVAGRSFPGCV